MPHYCGLHYSRPNYVSSTFNVGQGEWSEISGQRWHTSNYELVFPYRIWLLLSVTIILCKLLCHSVWLLMRINYSNYVSSMFEVGQAWTTSTFRSQVKYVKLWISIPIQVSTDDWLALSWLVNVGWSLILASYHHILQMFSTAARFVRAHMEFCIPWVTVIFAVSKACLMSPLHCFKLKSFLHWFLLFLSIINVTVMNLRFLYFSVCLQSVHFFSKFSCHGNTLLTVFSISEFSDPKHPFNTNSEGILHRTEVMT